MAIGCDLSRGSRSSGGDAGDDAGCFGRAADGSDAARSEPYRSIPDAGSNADAGSEFGRDAGKNAGRAGPNADPCSEARSDGDARSHTGKAMKRNVEANIET